MNNDVKSVDLSKLLTPLQASERYKISRKTLMKHGSAAGAIVRFGKSVRINIEKMDAYVDTQLTENQSGSRDHIGSQIETAAFFPNRMETSAGAHEYETAVITPEAEASHGAF